MGNRTVILGPYSEGVLKEYHGTINSEKFLNYLPPIDVLSHFYSFLIQAGAKRFDILSVNNSSILIPSSDYLKKRISIIPYPNNWSNLSNTIINTFYDFLPITWVLNQEYYEAQHIGSLILDLFTAIQIKRSLVTLLPVPEPKNISDTIPPDLAIPLSGFLSHFNQDDTTSPIPKHHILKEEVKLFKDLLESDVFDNLSLAHHNFESLLVERTHGVKDINKASVRITEAFKEILKPKKILLNSLSLIPTLADTLLEGFGKKFINLGSKILVKFTKGENRVIIYEVTPMLDQLFEKRKIQYRKAIEN